MENKQMICNLLCEALKATRDQADLLSITYDSYLETATLEYGSGHRTINVACDSGIAMMRDILRGC